MNASSMKTGTTTLEAPVVEQLTLRFTTDGLWLSVRYAGELASSPGSKTRTRCATRMAAAALRVALATLDRGEIVHTGFATNTLVSTDHLTIEKGEL